MPTKEDCIEIVGTRAITPYGRSVTKQLAADLSVAGLTIVSGMARGIDTVAHKATLEARGRTIAYWPVVWIAFILLKISSLCRILYRKERSFLNFF